MKAGTVLRPKETGNFKITSVASLILLLVYLVASYLRPWSPKKGLGLVFGFLAAFLFLYEMSYPWRRRLAVPPFSTAKDWLQAHIYLGVVALVAVVIHGGLRWPNGGMGWWLLGLSLWTTLTGILGVALQKWIPGALADGLRVEALYERIPELVEKLRAQADALMRDAGEILKRFYRREVRPSMSEVRTSWSYLLNVTAGQERALEPFRRMIQFVDPSERERVEDLMSLYTEKLELDAQYSLQGILRRWLILHVPAAGLLVGLTVVHIFVWVWY